MRVLVCVCVCVCVCVYVCVHAHACTYVCVCACVCMHLCVCACTCTCKCMQYEYLCAPMCVCLWMCAYQCVCVLWLNLIKFTTFFQLCRENVQGRTGKGGNWFFSECSCVNPLRTKWNKQGQQQRTFSVSTAQRDRRIDRCTLLYCPERQTDWQMHPSLLPRETDGLTGAPFSTAQRDRRIDRRTLLYCPERQTDWQTHLWHSRSDVSNWQSQGQQVSFGCEDEVINVDNQVFLLHKEKVQIFEHLRQHVGIHPEIWKEVHEWKWSNRKRKKNQLNEDQWKGKQKGPWAWKDNFTQRK